MLTEMIIKSLQLYKQTIMRENPCINKIKALHENKKREIAGYLRSLITVYMSIDTTISL